MKKLTIILTVMAVFFGFSQCETSTLPPVDISIDSTYQERTGEFAFTFLNKLDEEEKNENFFVSPLSLHMALGMLYNGTDGVSKEELENVLNLNGLTDAEINAFYNELIDKLPRVDPKVTNTLANSIWQREGFNVEQNFVDILKESFSAEVYEEPFNAATLDKINKWASDNTNKKIEKILSEISADQVMFLINALYFKGDWALEFDKDNTRKSNFAGKGKTTQVDMMAMRDTFALADMGTYKALDMEYGNGAYAMRVLLPEDGDANALIDKLNYAEWKAISEQQQVQEVSVEFPKLKMEYEIKLNDILKGMGVPSIFSSNADLSKISPPAGKLVVGFVKQNSFVEIDEEGTEAAAVTTIGIELTSVPLYETFHVDKPFVFFIYEKNSGTIQFAGKILTIEA